jgi:hypothetical protein
MREGKRKHVLTTKLGMEVFYMNRPSLPIKTKNWIADTTWITVTNCRIAELFDDW